MHRGGTHGIERKVENNVLSYFELDWNVNIFPPSSFSMDWIMKIIS